MNLLFCIMGLRLKVSADNAIHRCAEDCLIIWLCFFVCIGSPYRFHVDSISTGSVTAYGPGLETGRSGEPCKFTISTKGAGGGGLSLSVEGPSKANVGHIWRSIFNRINL